MAAAAWLAAALVAGCTGTPAVGPGTSISDREVPAHLTYVSNPTRIRARSVVVILPADLPGPVRVEGLSEGWREEGGNRVWKGTGACTLTVEELSIECGALVVTLVPDQREPEVLIQAGGNVSLSHGVRGLVKHTEGLSFLLLRNDRSLEKQ